MSTKRCYYETLEVERTADESKLKAAFRKLAMKWHPDKNPGSKPAEEMFKKISEAYEVLSSSERRQVYDRFGHEGLRSGGFTPSFDLGNLSDLFSAFFGDDLFGVGARRPRRGADLGAEI